MKINELKKEIERLNCKENINLKVTEFEEYLCIEILYGEIWREIAWVHLEYSYVLDVDYAFFRSLPEEIKEKILNLLVKFARTPTNEREEEKKYKYRLKEKYLWISNRGSISNNFLNLNYSESTPYIILNDKGQVIGCKTIFTDKEIQEVVDKFNVDLSMFDKIEVE